MNNHAGVYDTVVADVYRDDEYSYTFAAGHERDAYTSRTTTGPTRLSTKGHYVERSTMKRFAMLIGVPLLSLMAASCANKSQPAKSSAATQAPDSFRVAFETSRGPFVIQVNRAWAPRGADRFYDLVQQHFFDDTRFFRVVP